MHRHQRPYFLRQTVRFLPRPHADLQGPGDGIQEQENSNHLCSPKARHGKKNHFQCQGKCSDSTLHQMSEIHSRSCHFYYHRVHETRFRHHSLTDQILRQLSLLVPLSVSSGAGPPAFSTSYAFPPLVYGLPIPVYGLCLAFQPLVYGLPLPVYGLSLAFQPLCLQASSSSLRVPSCLSAY